MTFSGLFPAIAVGAATALGWVYAKSIQARMLRRRKDPPRQPRL